jgi:rhodanese-related sulfurtransferase
MMANAVPAIEVETLHQQMQGGGAPFILDVREPHEVAVCSIAGAVNIPLGQLSQRAQEIPHDRAIVAHCHHGGRSARAMEWLLQNGFMNVVNLTGGIDAWAQRIEPKMERY